MLVVPAPPTSAAGSSGVRYRHYDSREVGVRRVGVFELPGFPSGTNPVFVSITATEPTADGYLEVGPCVEFGSRDPQMSRLNFAVGESSTASAFLNDFVGPVPGPPVPGICGFASAPVHVIVDVHATPTQRGLAALNMHHRMIDTRIGLGGARLVPGRPLRFGGPEYFWATVTVLGAEATGTLRLGHCIPDQFNDDPDALDSTAIAVTPGPAASTMVLFGGQEARGDGEICVTSTVATDLILDLRGSSPATAIAPVHPGSDDQPLDVPAGGTVRVQLTDRKGDVALLTVTGTGRGYLSASSCDEDPSEMTQMSPSSRPSTQVFPTYASDAGEVCVYSSGGFRGTYREAARISPRQPTFDGLSCTAYAPFYGSFTVIEQVASGREVWTVTRYRIGDAPRAMTLRAPNGLETEIQSAMRSQYRAMFPISADLTSASGDYTVIVGVPASGSFECTGFTVV